MKRKDLKLILNDEQVKEARIIASAIYSYITNHNLDDLYDHINSGEVILTAYRAVYKKYYIVAKKDNILEQAINYKRLLRMRKHIQK